MNLWLKLFCSAGVLLIPASEGSIFLLGGNKGLTKKLEEKAVDSYSLYVFLFGFYTQKNVNSSPITLTGVIYTVQCSTL